MIAAITAITFGILATSSFALLCFGVNLLYLTWSSTRLRPAKRAPGACRVFRMGTSASLVVTPALPHRSEGDGS